MTKNRQTQNQRKNSARHPPLVSEIPACDNSGQLIGLPCAHALQPPIPVLESDLSLSRMLGVFDPDIHGGEVMAAKPVGRELNS